MVAEAKARARQRKGSWQSSVAGTARAERWWGGGENGERDGTKAGSEDGVSSSPEANQGTLCMYMHIPSKKTTDLHPLPEPSLDKPHLRSPHFRIQIRSPFFAPNFLKFVYMYLDRFLRGWGKGFISKRGEPPPGGGSIGFFSLGGGEGGTGDDIPPNPRMLLICI